MAAKKSKAAAAAPLRIEGEMTIYTAAELKERIVAALAADSVAIDLAQVGEIDSAGLQLLLLAQRETAAAGKSLALHNPSGAVLECLDLCALRAGFAASIVAAQESA